MSGWLLVDYGQAISTALLQATVDYGVNSHSRSVR